MALQNEAIVSATYRPTAGTAQAWGLKQGRGGGDVSAYASRFDRIAADTTSVTLTAYAQARRGVNERRTGTHPRIDPRVRHAR